MKKLIVLLAIILMSTWIGIANATCPIPQPYCPNVQGNINQTGNYTLVGDFSVPSDGTSNIIDFGNFDTRIGSAGVTTGVVEIGSVDKRALALETHYATDVGGAVQRGMFSGGFYIDVIPTLLYVGNWLYTEMQSSVDHGAGDAGAAIWNGRSAVSNKSEGTLTEMVNWHFINEIYANAGVGTTSYFAGLEIELAHNETAANHTITTYKGLNLEASVLETSSKLDGTNWYQIYIGDFVDLPGASVVTNQYGSWYENIGNNNSPTIRSAIVLDGNDEGSNIVFGNTQQISLNRDATSGYLEVIGGGFDVWDNAFRVGSDGAANTRTDATAKIGTIKVPHRTNAEEDVVMVAITQTVSHNNVNFGGGDSSLNAATKIRIYTAANNTTLTGTKRLFIDENGNFVFNTGASETLGTNAAGVIAINNGTAPATSVADKVQMWADDYGTGDSRLYIMGEASTNLVSLGNGHVESVTASIGSGGNTTEISSGGDVTFVGTAGLAYGGIYTKDSAVGLVVDADLTETEVTVFTVNEDANNTTPSHSSDMITITTAGRYMVMVSAVIEDDGNANHEFHMEMFKNAGANEGANSTFLAAPDCDATCATNDIITATHAFTNGDIVYLDTATGYTNVLLNTEYFICEVTSTTSFGFTDNVAGAGANCDDGAGTQIVLTAEDPAGTLRVVGTLVPNVHAHEDFRTSTDKMSLSLSGIVNLAVSDTISVWMRTDDSTARTVTVSDITMSIFQIGG